MSQLYPFLICWEYFHITKIYNLKLTAHTIYDIVVFRLNSKSM